jgi:D-arabinose 1-dehydrogenase-like Zn-dependent alcohol dehydrogenase
MLCAGVTTFNGIRHMDIPHGAIVAVQGLGGLGHLAVQYSRKMGYRTVALSSGSSKKDFAHQLGANDYIDASAEDPCAALQKLGGASLIVATAPNPDAIKPLLGGLGPKGKLLILAPIGPFEADTLAMIGKGLSVHGWPSGHQIDSEEAIAFADTMGVKCMVEAYPLADAQKAFDDMMAGKPRFRAVLKM